MVSEPTKECAPVDNNRGGQNDNKRFIVLIILLVVAIAGLIALLVWGIITLVNKDNSGGKTDDTSLNPTDPEPTPTPSPAPEPTTPTASIIDFQPIVDSWAASISGEKSVLIYDLDNDKVVGSYNTDATFNTASLYKLFVVYEGYRKIERGEWAADDSVRGTGHTVVECLDLAIRESNSLCAEGLWGMIGRDNLDTIIKKDFKIKNSDISSLKSNVTDITSMMKLYYEHPGINNETLLSRMCDSFLNQPVTEYNWRQGLPSGFSDRVNVYNKVGWDYNPDDEYWNLYHDTAILEVPELDRHYIITVMTHKVPFKQIRNLASRIEEKLFP